MTNSGSRISLKNMLSFGVGLRSPCALIYYLFFLVFFLSFSAGRG